MTQKFKVGDRVQFIYNNENEIGIIKSTTINGERHCIKTENGECMKSSIDLAPAPALVVVPQWFDDAYKEVIEYNWNEYAQKVLLHFIARTGFGNQFSIVENDGTQQYCEGATDYVRDNRFDLIRAVLDGYTVDKEPLYMVELPNLAYQTYLVKNDDGILAWQNTGAGTKFTESEIKAIDERYWQFAVPVKEVGGYE
ncbi:DUF1642 domain-containing protein [Listeria booriae]|uniref:DUF1642 domain-containing protein n=1 Tax=Listeria booriae TaxID=1552123 RepID=UPI00162923E8|nr:DUF1642 domain-containing protein [Listeria booriae]MBC1230512.1 DUF1642 domain-containing protein [Listeria booriae]